MPPVARVKGTQDFYPDAWAQQIALREIMLAAGRGYGYREYEGPLIEYLDLYLGKSSEEIVTQHRPSASRTATARSCCCARSSRPPWRA